MHLTHWPHILGIFHLKRGFIHRLWGRIFLNLSSSFLDSWTVFVQPNSSSWQDAKNCFVSYGLDRKTMGTPSTGPAATPCPQGSGHHRQTCAASATRCST